MRYLLRHRSSHQYGFTEADGRKTKIYLTGGNIGPHGRFEDIPRDDLTEADLKRLVGHPGFCLDVARGDIVISANALRAAGYQGPIPASPWGDETASQIQSLEAEIAALKSKPAPAVAQSAAAPQPDDIASVLAQSLQAALGPVLERLEKLEQSRGRK